MAKRSHPLRGGVRFTGAQYEPYAKAIGEFVLTWNDLHEKLALVFAAVLSHADRRNIKGDDPNDWFSGDYDELFKEIERYEGIWSSASFDRPKRAMLRGLLTPLMLADLMEFVRLPDEIGKDLSWILDEAEKLEELRNTVVHLPLLDPLYFEDDRPTHKELYIGWYKRTARALKLDRAPFYPLVPNRLMGNRRARAAHPSGGFGGFSSPQLLR